MTARVMIIAAAALSISSGTFAADPAKVEPRDSGASSPAASSSAKELVLASADLKSPANVADAQAQAPAKRRVARVTTCRCGDTQPQSDQE